MAPIFVMQGLSLIWIGTVRRALVFAQNCEIRDFVALEILTLSMFVYPVIAPLMGQAVVGDRSLRDCARSDSPGDPCGAFFEPIPDPMAAVPHSIALVRHFRGYALGHGSGGLRHRASRRARHARDRSRR